MRGEWCGVKVSTIVRRERVRARQCVRARGLTRRKESPLRRDRERRRAATFVDHGVRGGGRCFLCHYVCDPYEEMNDQ
jgi:hypothetical protein